MESSTSVSPQAWRLTTSNVTFLLSISLLTFLYSRLYGGLLGQIPGPFFARLSPLWLVLQSRAGNIHRTMVALHEKHGKLVRTGPNTVSVSDLSTMKKIYSPGTKFRKSDWYSVWQGHRKFDLFAERDESIHASQRRLVSKVYSMEGMKDLEPYVSETVGLFIEKMRDRQGEQVDLGCFLQLFAFDVIGEVTFSKRFGFMDRGMDDGSLAQIELALRSGGWVGQVPAVYWINDFLAPVIGNHLGVNARHGRIRNFAIKEIEERKDRGSDRRDVLHKLFEVQKEKPDEMTDAAVISMATLTLV